MECFLCILATLLLLVCHYLSGAVCQYGYSVLLDAPSCKRSA